MRLAQRAVPRYQVYRLTIHYIIRRIASRSKRIERVRSASYTLPIPRRSPSSELPSHSGMSSIVVHTTADDRVYRLPTRSRFSWFGERNHSQLQPLLLLLRILKHRRPDSQLATIVPSCPQSTFGFLTTTCCLFCIANSASVLARFCS